VLSSAIYFTLKAENLVDLGSLTTKLCLLVSTYTTSTVRVFSDNFRVWSHISWEWIQISIKGKLLLLLRSIPHRTQKNWWTTKFCSLFSNHPSLTLHLLYMYMIMACSCVRATWLCCKRNFNPLTVPQLDLQRRAALRWALPHISSWYM